MTKDRLKFSMTPTREFVEARLPLTVLVSICISYRNKSSLLLLLLVVVVVYVCVAVNNPPACHKTVLA